MNKMSDHFPNFHGNAHLEYIHKKIQKLQCIESYIELHKLITLTKIYYYIN